ncbi:serine/threonine-protein kinase [Herbidospora sp. NBRC 101105]|uniref:serine/threonine-protein kinase n=1 Tax=Herbidospora sp. NBRC 101105 TaxID=3032195 RepID=UPI002555A976|nr:serine/threonine-protein kinase [Herbidospora sp. NBRC 101105]
MDVGTVVADRYELVELLGEGGFGVVWKGFDQRLDRHVAVKFIKPEVFPEADRRAEALKRFEREARSTAKLRHPGVPIIHDIGPHQGRLYLVMEYVPGTVLDQLIKRFHPLPASWVAAIAAQVCAVLAVAHTESLIHRDLKPNNLIVSFDGTVKVLDFGVVAVLSSADITQITQAGEGVGTEVYMSPELVTTGRASTRSDLYALGCVIHEMLAGSRVFQADFKLAEVSRHCTEAPTPLRQLRSDVPEEIELLVLQLLAKNPDERPADAWEVYKRLDPFVGALPPLPGATRAAPAPDPMRMYATVVERIAASALIGPQVPAQRPMPVARLSMDELAEARNRAEELAVAGRFSQAIELLEHALAGTDSGQPVIFAIRMDLANSRFAARDFEQAATDFAELLPELTQMLGSDHRVVLECRFNHALCFVAMGENQKAIAQMALLMDDMLPAIGNREPLSMELRRELAEILVQTGDHRRAQPVLTALVLDTEAVWGLAHPESQHIRRLLEHVNRALG